MEEKLFQQLKANDSASFEEINKAKNVLKDEKVSTKYINGLEKKYFYNKNIHLNSAFQDFLKTKQGISELELNDLLKEFPNIPQSLIDILMYSNGTDTLEFFQSDVDNGEYPYCLIDSTSMIEKKDIAKKYSEFITRELHDIEIDNKITNNINNVKWLFFSDGINGDESQLFIDFTPSENGHVGQVVRFLHDPDSLVVIADSFDEYLQNIIDSDYTFIDAAVETNECLNNNSVKVENRKEKNKIRIPFLLIIVGLLALFILFYISNII